MRSPLPTDSLAQRVSDLEARVAHLEATVVGGGVTPDAAAGGRDAAAGGRGEAGGAARGQPDPEAFWALDALKARMEGTSSDEGRASGAVVFTGAVTLAGGASYEWQQGSRAAALLDVEWADAVERITALAHPVRLQVLREVLEGRASAAELSVGDGRGTTGQLYHHLRPLLAAGWLRSPARGRYEVPPARVIPLLAVLTALLP